MAFEEAFKIISKQALIKNLVLLKGWKKETVEVVLSRGKISKKMAPDIEEMTTVSALYWMRPDLYTVKGERR